MVYPGKRNCYPSALFTPLAKTGPAPTVTPEQHLDSIIVRGGQRLNGTVNTSGSKNAALPILFASLLADGEHRFDNVPYLKDIESTQALLASLGAASHRDGDTLVVTVSSHDAHVADYDMVRKMRAGILCLGPLLARYGEARVSLPGGCAIGGVGWYLIAISKASQKLGKHVVHLRHLHRHLYFRMQQTSWCKKKKKELNVRLIL